MRVRLRIACDRDAGIVNPGRPTTHVHNCQHSADTSSDDTCADCAQDMPPWRNHDVDWQEAHGLPERRHRTVQHLQRTTSTQAQTPVAFSNACRRRKAVHKNIAPCRNAARTVNPDDHAEAFTEMRPHIDGSGRRGSRSQRHTARAATTRVALRRHPAAARQLRPPGGPGSVATVRATRAHDLWPKPVAQTNC